MCSFFTTTSKLRGFGLAIFGYLLLHVKCLTSSHTQAVFTKVKIVETLSEIAHFRGGSRIFFMKVADTNRPPKYTLTYFKLSYDDLQTVTLQTLEKPQNRKK